jgi:hypothetical protein
MFSVVTMVGYSKKEIHIPLALTLFRIFSLMNCIEKY